MPKIRLLIDIPVDKRHGLTKGRVLELIEADRPGNYVRSDAGVRMGIFLSEFEFVARDVVDLEPHETPLGGDVPICEIDGTPTRYY